MAVTDHVNVMGMNPLQGPWDPRLGPRYPDMTVAYDLAVRAALHAAADSAGVALKDGVYAAVAGPSYETPAEIRMLRTMGADAVGMSTVPEVIVANQSGVRVAALSCISNRAAGLGGVNLSHKEVMEETARASRGFVKLLQHAVPLIAGVVAKPGEGVEKSEGRKVREQRSVGLSLKKKSEAKKKQARRVKG